MIMTPLSATLYPFNTSKFTQTCKHYSNWTYGNKFPFLGHSHTDPSRSLYPSPHRDPNADDYIHDSNYTTKPTTKEQRLDSGRGRTLLGFPKPPMQLRGTARWGCFPGGKTGRCVKMAIHFCPVSTLGKCGAMDALPLTPSYHVQEQSLWTFTKFS